MSLSLDDIKKLSSPFPNDRLGVKVQATNNKEDPTRAMLVLYLQHTDVYDRLEEVDPSWSCEVMSETWQGKILSVSVKMTVKGVSRQNVGEGTDSKSAYSDAVKRAAMLFGVGRYLYDMGTPWVPYNKVTDKYKQFTVEEFFKALGKKAEVPKPKSGPQPQIQPKAQSAPPSAFNFDEAFPENHPGDYIIKCGQKYVGKKLSQIPLQELRGYIDYFKKSTGPKGSDVREFIEMAEFYLKEGA